MWYYFLMRQNCTDKWTIIQFPMNGFVTNIYVRCVHACMHACVHTLYTGWNEWMYEWMVHPCLYTLLNHCFCLVDWSKLWWNDSAFDGIYLKFNPANSFEKSNSIARHILFYRSFIKWLVNMKMELACYVCIKQVSVC